MAEVPLDAHDLGGLFGIVRVDDRDCGGGPREVLFDPLVDEHGEGAGAECLVSLACGHAGE